MERPQRISRIHSAYSVNSAVSPYSCAADSLKKGRDQIQNRPVALSFQPISSCKNATADA